MFRTFPHGAATVQRRGGTPWLCAPAKYTAQVYPPIRAAEIVAPALSVSISSQIARLTSPHRGQHSELKRQLDDPLR